MRVNFWSEMRPAQGLTEVTALGRKQAKAVMSGMGGKQTLGQPTCVRCSSATGPRKKQLP